jgi:putative ABC transport system permease protein
MNERENAMLELREITKQYMVGKRPLQALNGINLHFDDKEFVAILGPSGCGKTTLLNLIGGLDQYTTGDLIIDGLSTKNFKDRDWDSYRNHRVGFVFQTYNLIMHLNVLQNVELSMTLSGVGASERKRRATKVLEDVGLGDKIYKKPNQLSGGEMQRVAIARSMVNKPDILLADEPTGALDSVTSMTILEMLKDISKKRLVIMVTHNRELAEKFATRIIKLKDGMVISDSANTDSIKVPDVIGEEVGKKTSMSFKTALHISYNNLLTKKGRTIMTAFAGSIGIIGVALVIAVSNGFTNYIHRIESSTLSGFPITVNSVAFNFAPPDRVVDVPLFPEEDNVLVYDQELIAGHVNSWTPEYFDYIEGITELSAVNSISYRYSVGMNLAVKSPAGNVSMWDEDGGGIFTTLSNLSTSSWHELLGDETFVSQYYEILGTEGESRYPESVDEVVLIVDEYNRVEREILQNLGLLNSADGNTTNITFDDIIGKQVRLFNNDEYYIYDPSTSITVTDAIAGAKEMRMYRRPDITELTGLFADPDIGRTITITGIMRPREASATSLMATGLGYLPELAGVMMEENAASAIATDHFNNYYLEAMNIGGTIINVPHFYSTLHQGVESSPLDYINHAKYLGTDLSTNEIIVSALDQLSTSVPINLSLIAGISIFPRSFADKEIIIEYLDAWNDVHDDNEHIYYTDLAENLTSSLGTMIDVISIVLIVFASISLVVSSVMIGIITYVSVIERTKEIGVLRAIGARKKDIARLFEAETVIIGFSAGVIGVVITLLLTIPINLILNAAFPGQGLGAIASLNPLHGLLLIIISVGLTLFSGLMPSRVASNKDPVVALRTE